MAEDFSRDKDNVLTHVDVSRLHLVNFVYIVSRVPVVDSDGISRERATNVD